MSIHRRRARRAAVRARTARRRYLDLCAAMNTPPSTPFTSRQARRMLRRDLTLRSAA